MCLSHKQEVPSCAIRCELCLLLCISREGKEENEGKDQGKRKTRREEEWSGMRKEDTEKILYYTIRSGQSMDVELDEAL